MPDGAKWQRSPNACCARWNGPGCWSTHNEREGEHLHHVFKTPLWRSAMKLDTDNLLLPLTVQ